MKQIQLLSILIHNKTISYTDVYMKCRKCPLIYKNETSLGLTRICYAGIAAFLIAILRFLVSLQEIVNFRAFIYEEPAIERSFDRFVEK